MSKFQVERLAVVSITAQNVPESVHFYRDVLGLKLLPHHGKRPAFDLGDVALVVSQREEDQPQVEVDFPVLTFAVQDIQHALEHLSANNIQTLGGIQGTGDTRWILFHDPAGNLVELARFGLDIKT